MAHDAITNIPMPELDQHAHDDGEKAVLHLVTGKAMVGIASRAMIHFAGDGTVTFEMYGDFRKTLVHDQTARATQKAIDALHATSFTPEAIESLKGLARAFYVDKAAKQGGR